jgi:hypothetical protein
MWCSAAVSVRNILLDSEIYVSVLHLFDDSNFLCLIKILHNIGGLIKIIKQLKKKRTAKRKHGTERV